MYNLATRQLKLISYPVEVRYLTLLGWQGDQLYMQASSNSPDGQTRQMFVTTSFEYPDAKVIPALPLAVQAEDDHVVNQPFNNSRFRVWSDSYCVVHNEPHCGQGTVLVVKNMRTQRHRIASQIEGTYFFDPRGSVVIYVGGAIGGRGDFYGLTALNLLTHRKLKTILPGDKPHYLMAEQRVPEGYLIAYSTEGDCNPADTGRQELLPPDFKPGDSWPSWRSVCFATIPAP